LPGTLRAELLATGEVSEEVVRVDELGAVARVWLVNSVRGWWEAVLVR
jgi:para-aminobenzoate synthetase/4-amino-4-deoxychorismate lyase